MLGALEGGTWDLLVVGGGIFGAGVARDRLGGPQHQALQHHLAVALGDVGLEVFGNGREVDRVEARPRAVRTAPPPLQRFGANCNTIPEADPIR